MTEEEILIIIGSDPVAASGANAERFPFTVAGVAAARAYLSTLAPPSEEG